MILNEGYVIFLSHHTNSRTAGSSSNRNAGIIPQTPIYSPLMLIHPTYPTLKEGLIAEAEPVSSNKLRPINRCISIKAMHPLQAKQRRQITCALLSYINEIIVKQSVSTANCNTSRQQQNSSSIKLLQTRGRCVSFQRYRNQCVRAIHPIVPISIKVPNRFTTFRTRVISYN
jgi:hypothetical protein